MNSTEIVTQIRTDNPDVAKTPWIGIDRNATLDTESAKINLLDICKVLETHGITHRVVFGTLLGLYRDGNIIAHDQDIDIALVEDRMGDFLVALRNLEDVGFRVVRIGDTLISIARYGVYADL